MAASRQGAKKEVKKPKSKKNFSFDMEWSLRNEQKGSPRPHLFKTPHARELNQSRGKGAVVGLSNGHRPALNSSARLFPTVVETKT